MPNSWRRWRRRLRAVARMPWSKDARGGGAVMLAAARILIRFGSEEICVARIGGTRVAGAPREERFRLKEKPANSEAFQLGPCWARVARHTWWRSMCLEQALAGRWMLRRRGIPSTMYVGMAKRGGNFIAHAWLVGEGRTEPARARKTMRRSPRSASDSWPPDRARWHPPLPQSNCLRADVPQYQPSSDQPAGKISPSAAENSGLHPETEACRDRPKRLEFGHTERVWMRTSAASPG